ncbi:MAG: HK97 family phage prohead protease, partial [bacterium]
MPYHIEEDHPDCTGFAVVKDDDDTLMGCHDTREDAEAQVAALYAAEADEEKKETMLKKTYTVSEFKALPDRDGKTGRFEALVAVFGNVDYQGDRVLKGAFTKSLQRWKGSGDPFPIIWSHDWGNPLAHIGKADPADMEETDSGLKIVGEIDLDSEFAAQVYRLMKERRVKEFSFGYDVVEERPGDDGANDLAEVDVIEAGPTLKGANPRTELLGVKAAL